MADLSCPSCATPVEPGELICPNCMANLTRSAPLPEGVRPIRGEGPSGRSITTSSFAVDCPHCGASMSATDVVCGSCLEPLEQIGPADIERAEVAGAVTFTQRDAGVASVHLRFRDEEVAVVRGSTVVLGRDPAVSPAAGVLTEFDNVSRRHAVVGVEENGSAWVRDERSTNGTFVNGQPIPAATPTPLRHGDVLRLAANANAQVSFTPAKDGH